MTRGVVLDADYMRLVAHRRRAESWIAYMAAAKGANYARGGVTPLNPLLEAREAYVSGSITLGAFEAKVDAILRREKIT